MLTFLPAFFFAVTPYTCMVNSTTMTFQFCVQKHQDLLRI